MRRLRVHLDLDAQGIPMNGYEVVAQVLTSAFKEELEPLGLSAPRSFVSLTYIDEDGDDIMVIILDHFEFELNYCVWIY